MKVYKDIIQGSDEWYELRIGMLTSSCAQAIATAGKGLDTLTKRLVSEKMSSARKKSFTNSDIERGHELEQMAVSLYELQTGNRVERIGFIKKDKYTGASTDGLVVGGEGLVEVKCLDDYHHFDVLMTEKIDSGYEWQIQMELLITGRQWTDYIGFNPNFEKDLFIKRFYPDPARQKKLKEGIKKGIKLIKELEEKYGE